MKTTQGMGISALFSFIDVVGMVFADIYAFRHYRR
jgi:hypothetical protein